MSFRDEPVAGATLQAQRRFFRLLVHNAGIPLKRLARESGISHSNLRGYAGRNPEQPQTAIPFAVFNQLAITIQEEWPEAIPFLSEMTAPAGLRLVVDDNDEDDDE